MGTLIGIVGVAVALLALLPGARWAAARVGRLRREAERVRLEDGLKHLLMRERAGRAATLEDLAGRLEVHRSAASDVLARLEERGLVASGASGPSLTPAGRAYALRVLRTHRLWERYLADRTGLPAGEWHAEAERVEHRLSAAEAERLSASLGHPPYDPHGDPIPTAGGEIPAPRGVPLTAVERGSRAVVVHVEDEPRAVFDRLMEAGLAPGVVLEVVEGAADGGGRVRVRADGRAVELRAVDAGNVTVERAGDRVGDGRVLAAASPGEVVVVTGIAPACQGPQRRRLLDLGVVPGTRITPELVSVSGDPVAYRIRGALIALRRQQAEWIRVAEAGAAGAYGAGDDVRERAS